MKKQNIFLLPFISALVLGACNSKDTKTPLDLNNIAFEQANILQQSFGGLGVEWGAYEDTDKLADGAWERILNNMDHLGAARIRLMVSYDWFCYNFDDKGDKDKTNDTWQYNFTNKYMLNTLDILDYCQLHNIDVAFGCWNVIGNFQNDVWNMMDEVTADIRWAKITADVLNFLVKQRGYTCIKWFVNSNEPNYAGVKGASKNWNNTYYVWEQGVKNVRQALDDIGLQKIGIVGGDTTGFEGTSEYLLNIADRIPDKVGDYGCHLYMSNIDVDRGEMLNGIKNIYEQIKEKDKGFGTIRQGNVWEAGLRDGKIQSTDCQTLIDTVSYAVRMVDYSLQCLAGGLNGICYWDFDDAMHFMYTDTTTSPKEWGMFSSLGSAPSKKQELRPWYHSSSLLCHLFKKGNYIYVPEHNFVEDSRFRVVGTMNHEGTQGGFVAVNQGLTVETKTFLLGDQISGDKLYIYNFNESSYLLGEDGFIIPNQIIDGSLNKKITIEIPRGTAVVVSNERL